MHRIVHVPFCYFPEAVGGTEVYVRDLAREQQRRGNAVMILAPADASARYEHDGLPVVRFAVPNFVADVSELYSSSSDIAEFVEAVTSFNADILHVHGVGRAVAPAALKELQQRGLGIVLTYHTPTTSCVRGTLLHHGAHPCDGALDAHRCTACKLTSHGVPATFASAIARAPAAAGTVLRAAGMRGRVSTALRMRELVTMRHDQTRETLSLANAIVAPAEWVVNLLRNLGVPPERVTLSRQGIRQPALDNRRVADDSTLRIVYVGRLEAAKGVHLLVEALRALPGHDIELHVYGVVQSEQNRAYRAQLERECEQDARVVLHDAVAPDDVVQTLANYDVLAAPSQTLETGPLVVLEAFAAGIPVVGSHLGGIAELVHDGIDGLLVETGSARAWATQIARLHDDRGLLSRLRANVKPPKGTVAVADEMDAVYARVA